MSDLGARLMFDAFMRGESMADIDDELRVNSGYTEDVLRPYIALRTRKERTHWRYRGSAKWLCGAGRITRNKDRVTCRRCIAHLVKEGRWE